ncbi:phosphatidate phosphatase PAH2 isoform X2 [Silene latifolia]|uniref:phosphatidate phosphatase PAH2 isoform X2 n=1 Tax=Silene latifolia TaxID=37657 RepID=UPI003D780354
MFAVGKIGSYISRGVYSVSGPFHPFGGAVDIVVVEQPDGTYKSSPWYVRFGKFQGVLKASEKVVTINVNGVDADFSMHLDHKGEAFFLREVEPEEGELERYATSGDETDVKTEFYRVHKSKSYNFDANRTDLVSELESSDGKSSPLNNSRRARLFGLAFGRRSIKENGFQDGEGGLGVDRVSSMERAEIAADLLDVRWTTNLKVGPPKLPPSKLEKFNKNNSFVSGDDTNKAYSSISGDGIESSDAEVPTPTNPLNYMGKMSLQETYMKVDFSSDKSHVPSRVDNGVITAGENARREFSEVPSLSSWNDSVEEQFTFSDLDDQKANKDVLLSPGHKDCLPRDASESSEDEVTETGVSDCKLVQVDSDSPSPKENLNRVYSPISISMPNIMFEGDGVSSYGDPERVGHSLDSNLEAIKIVNDVLVDSECNADQEQVESVQLDTDISRISEDIKKIISDPAVEVSLCRHLLSEGMGYEAAAVAFDAEKMDTDKFSSLGPDILKNDKLVVRIGGLYFPWDAALPIASAIGSQEKEKMLEPRGMIAVGQEDDRTPEGMQKSTNSQSGTWKIWPFLFKRSNSMQGKRVDSEHYSESPLVKVKDMDAARPKHSKRKIRAKAPTSEQLASLKLKEGKNEVTLTFSTAMLGKQQVDARIFLWKWNTRIVISDVDGTITKSDVLGQFMPLMGMDWSQTGVTHLFSAIKENGYQLLFLSARSISQACTTRQFLYNLKQDGKELPEGPVIISPDGLFPSLYREVIRRAPHEFKISCLEDIKVLFPPDQHPFYAGFGNRDTDELSYLRVGIPIGKIFIINPKGQIAVNRRVDTKSYTSLHSLVHGVFPPAPATEQEDYNSWNFWRLPPPDVI